MVHRSLRGGLEIPTPQGLATADSIPIPHSVDEDLKVEVIRQLEVVGQVDDLELIPAILPVISLGSVVPLTVQIFQPSFRSTDIFSAGMQVAQGANNVAADTGQLPAGIYDVQLYMGMSELVQTTASMNFEHRDAANAANLATYAVLGRTTVDGGPVQITQNFAYELAVNERIRIVQSTAFAAGRFALATIFARRRQ